MIFKRSTIRLYQYDNILLSNYVEIAQTANLQLLIISGKPSEKQLLLHWEELVKKNAIANGDHSMESYQNNLKRYGRLIADYEMVRLSLMKLILLVDDSTIRFLNSKGFRISTDNYDAYVNSINNSLQRSNSYLTKIKMKLSELKESREEMVGGKGAKPKTIEEVLGELSAALGFGIDSNITLARFNEYKRIAKKKAEPRRKQLV